MRRNSRDLHGNAPDNAAVALLLIDVINDLEFPEGDDLLSFALPMADRLQKVKQECQGLGIPCIYVNDNFGKWRSDLNAQVKHCLEDGVRGEQIVSLLRPATEDYFVLKPKHSGFFSTTLDLLLEHLGSQRLILTGLATNICVLFTANDAYQRGYELVVPSDCVAANTANQSEEALQQMHNVLKADIRVSTELPLSVWTAGGRELHEESDVA